MEIAAGPGEVDEVHESHCEHGFAASLGGRTASKRLVEAPAEAIQKEPAEVRVREPALERSLDAFRSQPVAPKVG